MERYSRREGREGGGGGGGGEEGELLVFYERGEKVKESGCKRRVGLLLRNPAVRSRPGENQMYFNGQ